MTASSLSTAHRTVLFNFLYDTDHLTWFYRSAVDSSPEAHLTSEHMCLVDFAGRAAALARRLLDDDNRGRDTRAGFSPAPSALRDRLRARLIARRQARKDGDAQEAEKRESAPSLDGESLVPDEYQQGDSFPDSGSEDAQSTPPLVEIEEAAVPRRRMRP